jgi:hypothetical protein
MKPWLKSVLVAVVLSTAAAEATTPARAADDPEAQAVLQADQTFEQAFTKSDKASAARVLDEAFTWTNASGKIATRALVLQNMSTKLASKLAATSDTAAPPKEYIYGKVAVVQVNSGKMHVLRVWVKRPAGWQALVYQEVQSLDAPPTVTPGAGAVCNNPCSTVPYHPKTAAQQAVVNSYMALETAAVAHNAADWSAHVADEFAAASSNSDQLLDKPTRMAGLEKEKMGGVSPTPLTHARMFDFGDSIVMISRHDPDHGKPLHITRVWIKRDANWVETLSYQTSIQVTTLRAAR